MSEALLASAGSHHQTVPGWPADRRGHVLASESVPQAVWRWLAAALDELDYGIVLVFDGLNVVHINDAARIELDDKHPLQLQGDELRAKLARDVAPLHEAVTDASVRGMRRLLTVGKDAERASVSIIPLEAADTGPRAVLVVLGKRTVCESLSVQGFARSYQPHGRGNARSRGPLQRRAAPAGRGSARRGGVDGAQPDRQHPAQDRRRKHPRPGSPGRRAAAGEGSAGAQRRPAGALLLSAAGARCRDVVDDPRETRRSTLAAASCTSKPARS